MEISEYDDVMDNIINYIDNVEFSFNSKEDIIFANRNIIRDSLMTFFDRFKNENNFTKARIRVFNKKVEKLYTILLGIILRYIRFIPNVVKPNYRMFIMYENMSKLTFYNVISNTVLNSKYIHDNMNELYLVNKVATKNKKTLVLDQTYYPVFLKMFEDILSISDFKIEVNEKNFNMNINSMLKLISAYSIKNQIYEKSIYPYMINGSYVYRSIKLLHLNKIPEYSLIYDRILTLLTENNDMILKTFVILFKDNGVERLFIPKSYYNKTKILFHCIEDKDDEIISNEAKLDIVKLREKELHDKIYIKIFGFSTILRLLSTNKESKYDNNERLCKIIEKVQDKLKNT